MKTILTAILFALASAAWGADAPSHDMDDIRSIAQKVSDGIDLSNKTIAAQNLLIIQQEHALYQQERELRAKDAEIAELKAKLAECEKHSVMLLPQVPPPSPFDVKIMPLSSPV